MSAFCHSGFDGVIKQQRIHLEVRLVGTAILGNSVDVKLVTYSIGAVSISDKWDFVSIHRIRQLKD